MKMIDFEIPCLRCGRVIRGRRREDEYGKHFSCKRCGGQFSITFELPDLEAAFIAGELRPGIVVRRSRLIEDNFPAAAIFGKRS